MTKTRPTLHRDYTVTYWSVYYQSWIHRAKIIPRRELEALSVHDRDRVIAHLKVRKQAEETYSLDELNARR
jgi:hypothetical protein